jgi:hypothetical protein
LKKRKVGKEVVVEERERPSDYSMQGVNNEIYYYNRNIGISKTLHSKTIESIIGNPPIYHTYKELPIK